MIKKIIFTVTPIFSIPPKGAAAVESWIYQVAKRLKLHNKIICVKNEGYTDFTQVNKHCSIHRIGFSRIYKRLFQKLTRLDPVPYSQRILNIKNKFADDVESVTIVHNSMKLYRQIKTRSPKTNVILHMHNAFPPKNIDDKAKIIVPSVFLRNYFQSFLPEADIAVVPNGVDVIEYKDNTNVVSRSSLGIKDNDTLILFAGRIIEDKGVLQLLQAVEKITPQRSDIKLLLIGAIDSTKKGEKAEFQNKVLEVAYRLKSHCIMIGSVAPDDMNKYYPLADLVVIPSQVEEAFCMVAIEAMCAGSPVLVSPRGGMPEFVLKNQTGYHLSEPLSAESIAKDIGDVLKDPNLTNIARQGQKYVAERFSWESVTDIFMGTLKKWFVL